MTTPPDQQTRWPLWLAGALIAMAAVASYWPGLHGGFLFDDFVNLDALGSRGPIDNAAAFWRYLTSGTADPTGRPLALLSFLIDARDWPADPAPFLRTNLAIHLLNGALLFLLLRQLGRRLGDAPSRAGMVALTAAACWLLHPLWVSTTLYIVQREAMLPATVTLLTLMAYFAARDRFERSDGAGGSAAMAASLATGTLLATACKANGILLPLLTMTLVLVLGRAKDALPLSNLARHRLRQWDLVLLALPSLAILGYLGSFIARLDVPIAHRPWTIAERLLTEPRVIVDYLQLLWIPRSVSTGLFNDNYPVSVSLWSPASTLPAMLALIAIAAGAVAARRHYPRLAAALLFFLAGHVMESSAIPLELYFEHRNYLPAMLMFWPLASAIADRIADRRWRLAATAGMLALLAATTWQRAVTWGQPDRLAALWAARNPDSSRTQASMAIALVQSGRAGEAVRKLTPWLQKHPDDLQLLLNYANARCADTGLDAQDKELLRRGLANNRGSDLMVHQWLARSINQAAAAACPGLALADVSSWISAAAANPRLTAPALRAQTIEPLLGQIALAAGDGDAAKRHYSIALSSHRNPDFAGRLVSSLAAAGYPRQALALLDEYQRYPARPVPARAGMPWLHDLVLRHQGFWDNEFASLRAKLREDLASRESSSAPPASPPATPP